MKAISIDNYKLHKIQMLLEPYSKGSIAYLSYPKHKIKLNQTDEILILKIPAFLCIELYRRGILPSSAKEKRFNIKISGKKIGDFIITDFRYPHQSLEEISITFKKI